MNLIQELSVEKCRAILEGSPDGANEYSVWASLSYYKTVGERCELWKQHYKWWTPVLYNSYMKQHRRSLDDLRTAIEQHDKYWYGRSEEDEIKAYAKLSQEKIEGGAMLVGDFSEVRKIIEKQLESDECTDIRNHISPNTKVIEG